MKKRSKFPQQGEAKSHAVNWLVVLSFLLKGIAIVLYVILF